jgi:hypothetical protein
MLLNNNNTPLPAQGRLISIVDEMCRFIIGQWRPNHYTPSAPQLTLRDELQMRCANAV